MPDLTQLTLTDLAKAYQNKTLSPIEVTQAYFNKLEPLNNTSIYRALTKERALKQARLAEQRFMKGVVSGPLQGVPLALKDLLDTEGELTSAGSRVLAENPVALEDSPVAARLHAAGAVFLGKTNMTELAFSGLGLNPHFGTPGSALNDSLIPGGSSSGSGVAVGKHLACAAIGSDTGGSVRIPASFNGIVGLKTTNGVVPKDKVTPLSTTLDTIGPMTRSVEDAWHIWRVLAAKKLKDFGPSTRKLRLLMPSNLILNQADTDVITGFEKACTAFEDMGHEVIHQVVPELERIPELYARYGSFASHESLTLYEDLLEARGDEVDARVAKRILEFRGRPSTDYINLVYAQQALIRTFWENYRSFDAVLAPTVAILPPSIKALEEDDALYFKTNNLCLRNTMLFNFLAGPAVSVPCYTTAAGLSVGLMVATAPNSENLALRIAALMETPKNA